MNFKLFFFANHSSVFGRFFCISLLHNEFVSREDFISWKTCVRSQFVIFNPKKNMFKLKTSLLQYISLQTNSRIVAYLLLNFPWMVNFVWIWQITCQSLSTKKLVMSNLKMKNFLNFLQPFLLVSIVLYITIQDYNTLTTTGRLRYVTCQFPYVSVNDTWLLHVRYIRLIQ